MEETNKYKGLFYNGDNDIVISETKKNFDTDKANKESHKISRKVSYTLPNGDKYEGMEENNKRNGLGIYIFSSGNKYKGEFKDGMKHGQGTYYFLSGDKFIGQFQNNKRDGQGTFFYIVGEKYEGEFKNNKKHGQGTYIFLNGSKFIGHWQNDTYHGYGEYYYPDGQIYKGDFKDGKKNGVGVHTWNDGEKNKGEWKDDFMIDAPGSFGFQYTNLKTNIKNQPSEKETIPIYIEPGKLLKLLGTFLPLAQQLFSLKQNDYSHFVVNFFDFSVRANAYLKAGAYLLTYQKSITKSDVDSLLDAAKIIEKLGIMVVNNNLNIFENNNQKLLEKYYLEYKNRDGIINKSLSEFNYVYASWELISLSWAELSKKTDHDIKYLLLSKNTSLKQNVNLEDFKKSILADFDSAITIVVGMIKYLTGAIDKSGHQWENFVELFLRKYWEKFIIENEVK